ncbi:hypothetical protein O0L34_g5227 [Tuta absoluta]|nr:hypothetical protein O0L34_g5227 [Tuta absoluta]
MSTSELDSRNLAISMRKSVENLVISSQDAIGQSISQALTFSGVITQQTHQMMDTRNVSRSPSPSLRNSGERTSEGADSLENDKDFCTGNLIEASLLQGELSIQVPSHPAGDTVSVSSASDIAPLPTTRPDYPKVSTPNPSRSADPAARVKKKSWYTSLYPTYKSKSDDFKRLFKDLPDDERLIVDYSCALQKDILAHGRLYASQNYLCFYASIFGWETNVTLRWKDVTAITKEKTALVIPNAILVCMEGEKHFLTSFSGRDKAYLMLFRIWQNALMDQPNTSHDIWQWVHSCYGEELGFGSDDEGYSRDTSLPALPPLDANSELDLVDSSMEAVSGAETRDDRSTRGSRSRDRDSSPPLMTNGDTGFAGGGAEGDGEGDTLPTDMSDTSDSDDKDKHTDEKCTSDHSGKLIMRGQFQFNIDQLFTMIFTNSKFNLELLAARRTTDYVQAPWQVAGGQKCRQVSYVLGLTSGPIGPKEVHVTETQVMNKCSKPGHLYSINASSENSGIPYADYFTVECHYCLSRISEHMTDFSLIGYVKYKKSMWPMVKAFLEKNTISGLEEYGRMLESRLIAEAQGQVPAARKSRRQRRSNVSSSEVPPITAKVPPAAILAPRASLPRARPAETSTNSWLAGSLVILLALNALLYWRLYHPPHGSGTKIKIKQAKNLPLVDSEQLNTNLKDFIESTKHLNVTEKYNEFEKRLKATENIKANKVENSKKWLTNETKEMLENRSKLMSLSEKTAMSSSEVPPITAKVPPAAILAPRASLPRARPAETSTNSWLAGSLVILLALNALLYWRLYHPPHGSDLQSRLRTLGAGGVGGEHMADWSAMLDTHTNKQRGQLLAWKEALDNTVTHLRQTELALRKLLDTIEPSLAKAGQASTTSERTDTHTSEATDRPPDGAPTHAHKPEL